ncbi:MAG: DUF3991 domain-containing protein [Clostridiaceae bacterium]|nr:DUF3991 domain-containing protein [Clostridiaceae bacterium]
MAQYIHFSDEQKLRANSVDLPEFLRRRGEKLIPSGRDKRLASDHSVTVRGNQWFDHASEKGGLAIDFVQQFYGLSFPDAVTMLLGGETGVGYLRAQPKQAQERKPFALPPAHTDMRRVYAYLLQYRHIDREVLTAFVREKLIYESAEPSADKTKTYYNAVFVGNDEHGVARHGHKRSIYTVGNCYRGNIESSDPRYSFHWVGASEKLFVFEAPIDMLSYISLHPEDGQEHSYVSLCGTAEHAMLWMLMQYPQLDEVVVCLDNDDAGIKATERLTAILMEHGHDSIQIDRSGEKDWNDELVSACEAETKMTMRME